MIFLNFLRFFGGLGNFLDFSWIFLEEFFGRIFLGGFFWEEFFGRIFLGGFFGRIFLGGILWEELLCRN